MQIEELVLQNGWLPYPENKPKEVDAYRKPYLVTMETESQKHFTSVADWCRFTVRGKTDCRWEYKGRVFFPWTVIAFMEMPAPYKAEADDNPQLTWQQLKQMEGQPIYIETESEKGWQIIEFRGSFMRGEEYIKFGTQSLYGSTLGAKWQAYRRQRKEA